MLLKNIMNTIENKKYPNFHKSSSYEIYKNTLYGLSDISFFNYCIYKNKFLSKEENEIVMTIYIESKNILNIINRFSKKLKYKIYKKYENDMDFRFISFKKYDKSEIVDIIQNKTVYSFRILDLVNLWKISLYANETMFPKPTNLKNPYTNMIFKKYNLYNIFISFSKTNFIIPDCILEFYKCNFDMYIFKKNFFPKLQYNAIENYSKDGSISDHYDYIVAMLHDFRKTTNYSFVETRCSIFKKMKIVDLLRKILCCYLKQKFLCNPLLKENYKKVLKKKLKIFFQKNRSLSYFFFLNEREILRYESSELLVRSEETLNELLNLNENDVSSNIIVEESENINNVSNTILSDTNNTNSHFSLTQNNDIVTNTYRNSSVYRRRRSSVFLPPIVQNTYSNNIDPFQPSRQLSRSPTSSRLTTSNIMNNTGNIRVRDGINITSSIRNRLSFGL
tara:strand:- start:3439 stop:4785 length:1347 start_codon:yes stop_codon:yes gene_type:complete